MTMAFDRPALAGTYFDRSDSEARRPLVEDPEVRALVARRDDRLLRDVGLTREEALGPQGYFWSEWTRTREPWSL